MSRVTVSESEVVTVVWVTQAGTIVSEAQRREPLATGPGWILQSRCSHAAVTLLARDNHVTAVTVASLSPRLPSGCAKYIPLSREPSAAAPPTVTPAPGAAAVRV